MEKSDKYNKGNKNKNLELQKSKTMENIKTQFLGEADPDNLNVLMILTKIKKNHQEFLVNLLQH